MHDEQSPRQRILQVIHAIPPGKVASYGQVAQIAGLGRGARQVAAALRNLPEGSGIPWFRVINAGRTISIPEGSPRHAEQRQRLMAEGVEFDDKGRVPKRFFWQL